MRNKVLATAIAPGLAESLSDLFLAEDSCSQAVADDMEAGCQALEDVKLRELHSASANTIRELERKVFEHQRFRDALTPEQQQKRERAVAELDGLRQELAFTRLERQIRAAEEQRRREALTPAAVADATSTGFRQMEHRLDRIEQTRRGPSSRARQLQ